MPIVVDLNEIAYFREIFEEAYKQGYAEGFKQGYAKGFKQGRDEAREIIVVRVRKKHGYSVEQIADLLSLDEGFVRSALEKAGIS